MRNLLSLIVGMAILAFAGTAIADISIKNGVNYKQFIDAVNEKCGTDGVCVSPKAARKAERKRNALIRACNSKFGASAAGPCISESLGSWAGVTFRFVAEFDPCKPNPCQNGGICSDAGGKAACNCSGTGFTGDRCQKKKDDPKVKWCASLRKRIPLSEKCPDCPKGTKLRKGRCVPNGNLCDGVCNSHGTCSVANGKPVCDCESGWIGDFCDEKEATEVFADSALGGDICCQEGFCVCDEFAAEYKTPWTAIILIQLFLVLLGLTAFWWFIRKKASTSPSGGIGEEQIDNMLSKISANVDQGFSNRLSTPLRKFVTFVISHLGDNQKIADAFEQGMDDLMKSFEAEKLAAAEPATEEEEEALDESVDE